MNLAHTVYVYLLPHDILNTSGIWVQLECIMSWCTLGRSYRLMNLNHWSKMWSKSQTLSGVYLHLMGWGALGKGTKLINAPRTCWGKHTHFHTSPSMTAHACFLLQMHARQLRLMIEQSFHCNVGIKCVKWKPLDGFLTSGERRNEKVRSE